MVFLNMPRSTNFRLHGRRLNGLCKRVQLPQFEAIVSAEGSQGVVKAYNGAVAKYRLDSHVIEHKTMDRHALSLWQLEGEPLLLHEFLYMAFPTRSV